MTEPTLRRRALLRGAAVSGVLAIGGCGDDDAPSTAPPSSEPPTTTKAPRTKPPRTKEEPDQPSNGSAGGLGPASAVAVGGGVIYAEQEVVVTQPTKGEFKGFDTTCTHQGCPVTSVKSGEIECPCHFSRYSIADGSVVSGPAPAPLAAKPVRVEGERIVLD